MIKIWAKTVKDNKIIKSIIFQDAILFNKENFEQSIENICQTIDEPCPIVLTKNYKHFEEFNITEFKSDDFVETVKFDRLILENALTD